MSTREQSGDLLRARLLWSYLAASHFLIKFNGRSYGSRRRQTPNKNIGAEPILSTEKLRLADTDRDGHISTAVFAVCCQNARTEVLSDHSRTPVSDGAQFVSAWLQPRVPGRNASLSPTAMHPWESRDSRRAKLRGLDGSGACPGG